MSQRIMLALAWTAILLTLVLIPGRWIHAVEVPLSDSLFGLDKFVHCGLFVLYSAFWMRTGPPQRRLLPVLVGGFVLAIFTEWAQGIPAIQRDPDVWDGLADITGMFLGLGGFYLFWMFAPQMRSEPVSLDA